MAPAIQTLSAKSKKQTVSALATLAAGLAGGIAKGDSAGAGAGRNAVENNLLANKYGVERLDKASLALYEKLKAAGIGSMDELQKQFVACGGNADCERNTRNEYRNQEKEAGEKLVALYQAGNLTSDEFGILVSDYARAMMEGAKEGQLNSDWGGFIGDIYRLTGNDWTPIGTISNPYLAIIKSSEQIAEWQRQGLSDEKNRELSIKDGVISSVLAPVDINGITNLLNNGASEEELVKFAMITAFGRAVGGNSKLSKDAEGSGAAGQSAKGLIGQIFEKYLYKELGGKPSFSTKGREFDGAYGANNSIWYEAKSGRYWEDHAQAGSKGFDKFKSDVGAHARIAKDNGASFEVHSNTPIPQHAKEWLSSKGIFFKEY